MTEPAIGERCYVRPQANLRVQEHAHIAGRIMPDAWTERVWDDWLHARYRSGEILVKPIASSDREPTSQVQVEHPIKAKKE